MLGTIGAYKIKKDTYSGDVHILVCRTSHRVNCCLNLHSIYLTLIYLWTDLSTISELEELVEKIMHKTKIGD